MKNRLYKIRNTPIYIKKFFLKIQPEILERKHTPVINYYKENDVEYVGMKYEKSWNDNWVLCQFSHFGWYESQGLDEFDVIIWNPCNLNMKEIDI